MLDVRGMGGLDAGRMDGRDGRITFDLSFG